MVEVANRQAFRKRCTQLNERERLFNMSNLTKYGFRYRGIESADKIFGEAPDGEYVKFDDIKELRSSTDVQQLKPKMPSFVEFDDWYKSNACASKRDIYDWFDRHFGH